MSTSPQRSWFTDCHNQDPQTNQSVRCPIYPPDTDKTHQQLPLTTPTPRNELLIDASTGTRGAVKTGGNDIAVPRKFKPVCAKKTVPKSSKWAKFVVDDSSDESDKEDQEGSSDILSSVSGFCGLDSDKHSGQELDFNQGVPENSTNFSNPHVPNFTLGDDLDDLIGL